MRKRFCVGLFVLLAVSGIVFSGCALALAAAVDASMERTIASGDSYFEEGDYERAMEEYTRALRNARHTSANISLIQDRIGNVYFAQGDYTRAAASLRTASRLNPGSAEIRANLARAEQALFTGTWRATSGPHYLIVISGEDVSIYLLTSDSPTASEENQVGSGTIMDVNNNTVRLGGGLVGTLNYVAAVGGFGRIRGQITAGFERINAQFERM